MASKMQCNRMCQCERRIIVSYEASNSQHPTSVPIKSDLESSEEHLHAYSGSSTPTYPSSASSPTHNNSQNKTSKNEVEE